MFAGIPAEEVEIEAPNDYACSIEGCLFKSRYQFSLKRHEQSVHNMQLFKCTHCAKDYKQKSMLEVHIKMVHKNEGCMCTQCGKRFGSRSGLTEHEQIHTEGKQFLCVEPDCGKAFTRASRLQAHASTSHGREKPYACEICHKRYSAYLSLKVYRKYSYMKDCQLHVTVWNYYR